MTVERMNLFLQEVLAHPADDEPRIAYANACEAVGELLRAQFIRLQIESIREGDSKEFHGRHPYLVAHELSQAHGREWAGPIKDRVARYEFYRGFVEEIQIDAKLFLSTAEELYALAPIRKLFVTGLRPVMKEFFESPYLDRIAVLYAQHQQINDEEVRLIAKSPYLGKLVALGLRGNDVTLEGVEALAASTTLPSLKDVDLIGNPAEVVREIVSVDGMDPRAVWAEGSVEAEKIEAKYGRKTWLHTVEDHGFRIPVVFAEC